MKKLFFGLFLLCASLSYGAGLPEPPTPIVRAPMPTYQPATSTFGYPSPWYVAPPTYTRPFDNYYYQSQPSMYYICGSYGLYYTQRIR